MEARQSLSISRALLALLLVLSACSTLGRHDAVPAAIQAEARVSDMPANIRYSVGDARQEAALAQEFVRSWKREGDHLASRGNRGSLPPATFLALSGGGDDGAFGAGLLAGWTAAGSRPEFKLVTGISTGALIAPFAFLGSAYDEKLKALYTHTSAADILETRWYLAAVTNDAMADTRPLRTLLRKHIDRAFLNAIADEYAKGRELWIATTNLDSRVRYIWNMTRIAVSQHPRALDLFHSLMIASAAIPGAFPPVMIDVEVGGRRYQEMHVDGGAMSQVFVYPIGLDFETLATEHDAQRARTLYVIRNSRLDPDWAQVERRTLSIAARAISSLIHTQGVGDLYRIFLTAQRDGLDFNLAYIPASFHQPHTKDFDPEYMRPLYALGYAMAARGYPWEKAPPEYATPQH
jgi:predicted acylesterase/phospholipase RssA